jgi:predicted amidohydrolase
VWFVRGNNVVLDPAKSGISGEVGVGYGDSYIMDPGGEIVSRSRRHAEDFIMADIDPSRKPEMSFGMTKSAWSFREFGKLLAEAAGPAE